MRIKHEWSLCTHSIGYQRGYLKGKINCIKMIKFLLNNLDYAKAMETIEIDLKSSEEELKNVPEIEK